MTPRGFNLLMPLRKQAKKRAGGVGRGYGTDWGD